MTRKATWLVVLTIFVLFSLAGCSAANGPGLIPTPYGAYPVATQFRDIYSNLGGSSVLGQAISPPFRHDNLTCQYLESSLFCFNPQAALDADRVFLVPLGTMLVTEETSQAPKVYSGFSEMYYRLFGTRYVGEPLSEVQINKEKRRVEQHFEKLGFYQLMDDPRGVVHLISYGSYACREYCTYKPYPSSAITGWIKGVDVPGLASLNRLGGTRIFGEPLSHPYTAGDKSTEQLFGKVLTYIPADNPSTLRLRPLAVMLGMPRTAPEPQSEESKKDFVFYPVTGKLGYIVPLAFNEFLVLHGGAEISGKPISDPRAIFQEDGTKIAQQCFENYCLEYDPSQPENEHVRLSDLGEMYQKKTGGGIEPLEEFSPKNTELKVSEAKNQISSNELQVIEVSVVQARDKAPIADVESLMVIGMPDGSKPSIILPMTGLDGKARMTLPAFSNAANGSVIPYVVCLIVPTKTQICQGGSFVIWNSK